MRTSDLLRHVGADVELGVQERGSFRILLGKLGRHSGEYGVTTKHGLVYLDPQFVSYCETLPPAIRREWAERGIA